MMTLVRVLPPDKYGKIMDLVKEAGTDVQPAPPEPAPRPLSLQAVGAVID